MTVFEKIKTMNIDKLAEWIDEHGTYDDSPWMNWWNNTYCKKCESETVYAEYLKRNIECAWCELYEKCRFFQDMNEVPDCKQTIKLWLESEA